MGESQRAQDAVRTLLRAGIQVSPDALSYLAVQPDPIQLASKTLEELNKRSEKPLVITRSILEGIPQLGHARLIRIIGSKDLEILSADKLVVEAAPSIEILSPLYETSSSEGKLEDFIAYFRDRYQKLMKLFRARKDTQEAVTVSMALKQDHGNGAEKQTPESNTKVIGLATSKKVTNKGSIIVQLEDPTGIISGVISSKSEKLVAKGSRILLDQVFCMEGVLRADKSISVRDITWADVPYDYKPSKAKDPVYAVLVSDIHYGSTKFLRGEFEAFILWLRGEGATDESARIAKGVRYLVIAGDLVDGLGVYPNQEDELEVKDIYEQYSKLSEYLRKIPSTIEIIAIPGNHDATRLSLPQPPISEKYIEPITKTCSTFHMLGNPAFVKIHNVGTLIYHGKIIDNILSTLPEISSKTVTQALHELMRCRHLAPTWDPDNPMTPANEDLLVMERIPDIFHTGHIHINAVSQYRGVLAVNSGTFQSQTSYQKSMGVKPTPGRVDVVNLMTLKPSQIQFAGEASNG
ncbi:MAG: DNA-directed DNA polymerase II small subunit [Promethearchaeati archaeon SRVP18_Atabeyarchaeia-1]